jgi:glyoxylase I family protein
VPSARACGPPLRCPHGYRRDLYGGTVYLTPSGALFGLRPVAPEGQRFDSEHTGLDHVSFMVSSRDDLTAAGIAILSFSDPDGVHCELTAVL